MTPIEFSKIAPQIPTQPGIYKYFSVSGELLYVGKAKHLKKRISSYFNKQQDNKKTIELVGKIHQIEFTIVDTEEDAFLLENNLIKQYQPKYNISLKDDKTYPQVVIKKERFPRVFISRRKFNDGAEYFGPYTSTESVNEILSFIKKQFPFRTCKLNLSQDNITKNKFKVCLEYHIGNCKGPCQGFQNEEDYNEGVSQLRALLKGNTGPLMHYLKSKMTHYAEQLDFEKAEQCRQKIDHLIQFQSKSSIVNSKIGTIDVFAVVEQKEITFINYLAINNGSIIHTKTIEAEKKLNEDAAEVFLFGIAQLRKEFESKASEIIVPFYINYPETGVKITVPSIGDKKKLLELAQKNAAYASVRYKIKKPEHENTISEDKIQSALLEIKDELKLSALPLHIECFDNSNLQGTNAVAAMVCFINGVADKSNYRRFNIKTVQGINDFASMKEIVFRRYLKIRDEGLSFPDLIIIDGGKGQLSAAVESMHELGLMGKTTLVGLAKNKEELFFPGDSNSIVLPWDGEGLKLIRRIRDEVHRFGITFHRNKRSKNALTTVLSAIKGIGENSITALLQQYKTINRIKQANPEDLVKLIGLSKTRILLDGLQSIE
jgi:excinuclease ABC subunit C